MRGILKPVAPKFGILNNGQSISIQLQFTDYAESLQPGSKMANNLAIPRPQSISVADSGSIARVRAHSQEVRGLILS